MCGPCSPALLSSIARLWLKISCKVSGSSEFRLTFGAVPVACLTSLRRSGPRVTVTLGKQFPGVALPPLPASWSSRTEMSVGYLTLCA